MVEIASDAADYESRNVRMHTAIGTIVHSAQSTVLFDVVRQNHFPVFDVQRFRRVLVLHQPTVVPKQHALVIDLSHLLAKPIDELAEGCVDFDSVAVLTPVLVDYDNS